MSRLRTATFLAGAAPLRPPLGHGCVCVRCVLWPALGEHVVSGHRMVLSIAASQTTLYDRITYQGNPSSFAWVLPIHGQVKVGISADVMFQTLDAQHGAHGLAAAVLLPWAAAAGARFHRRPSESAGIPRRRGHVLAQETVGPYETVQLRSADPTALKDMARVAWLCASRRHAADHCGVCARGMNFLALKLVPGAGVAAMRPVRVTMPGAAPVLPLRMVAGGTGATVPITLWVIARSRVRAPGAVFPFRIAAADTRVGLRVFVEQLRRAP